MTNRVLTGADIESLAAGELIVPPDTIVTERARDIALARGVAIRTDESAANSPAQAADSGAPRVVALGADLWSA